MTYDVLQPAAKRRFAGSQPMGPSVLGLQRNRLLDGIPLAALQDLARQCRWRRYSPEQQIISREAGDNDVYLVISGRVRVTAYSAGGRQVLYGDKGAGEWFGDFAAIDGLSRSADVIALEDTLVAAMSPEVFRRLLREQPGVCERMLQRLVACVRELTERVFDVSTLGVQNRLHAELLRLARQGGVRNNSARLDPAPRHADLAGQISTYREQITRELSAMAKEGLIAKDGQALVIRDVARLERTVAQVRRSA